MWIVQRLPNNVISALVQTINEHGIIQDFLKQKYKIDNVYNIIRALCAKNNSKKTQCCNLDTIEYLIKEYNKLHYFITGCFDGPDEDIENILANVLYNGDKSPSYKPTSCYCCFQIVTAYNSDLARFPRSRVYDWANRSCKKPAIRQWMTDVVYNGVDSEHVNKDIIKLIKKKLKV